MRGAAPARLDHVSLELGEPAAAACERLGLRLTPTPGRDHGRVLLDRRYLEVGHGERLRASALFFALSEDRRELETLRAAGLRVGDPEPYDGHDGVWEDCVLAAPSPGGPLVALTRRVEPLAAGGQLVLSPSAGPLRVTAVELGAGRASLALELEAAATITRRMSSTDKSVS